MLVAGTSAAAVAQAATSAPLASAPAAQAEPQTLTASAAPQRFNPAIGPNRAGGLHRDRGAGDHPGQQRTSLLLNRRGAESRSPV